MNAGEIINEVLIYLHNQYLQTGVKGLYFLDRICHYLDATQVKFIGNKLNETGFADYKFETNSHRIRITDKGIEMFENYLNFEDFVKSEFLRKNRLPQEKPTINPIKRLVNAIIKSVANLAKFIWTNKLLSSIIIFVFTTLTNILASHFIEYNYFQKWYKDTDSVKIKPKDMIKIQQKQDTLRKSKPIRQ